jgi:NitT/TauT family transport system substrate-binding protein
MAALDPRPALARLVALAGLGLALLAQPAAAQTQIHVMLAGRPEGPAAPFLLPLDGGQYRGEGLDVTIDTGAGSAETIARVASGAADIGFADINELIRMHDHTPATPVKAVFMVYNIAPYAIVARKSRGIAVPKDLEGKKLGAPSADPSYAVWPLFAKLNDVDAGKVAIENVGIPVREPMLAAGQLDAVIGFSFAADVDLKERGVPPDDIVLMKMSDYGLTLYGSAVLVNTKFATENPEAVRAFLRAFTVGLKETIKNPARAVEAVLSRNDGAEREVEIERLRMALHDNILTPEVKAEGFGNVDPERFQRALDQMGLTYKFKARPALADVFDASFLPDPADRKIH